MANQEHLDLLRQGSDAWNAWRTQHQGVQPDLIGANLDGANLSNAHLWKADLQQASLRDANLKGANFNRANLRSAELVGADLKRAVFRSADFRGANLSWADLREANFSGADLRGVRLGTTRRMNILLIDSLSPGDFSGAIFKEANLRGVNFRIQRVKLSGADLSGADLSETDLRNIDLSGADLSGADLSGADLSGANLSGANLSKVTAINTNFTRANLTGSRIFGISAWNVNLTDATQNSLIITDKNDSAITVDNLEFAQSVYLLLNDKKIRDVINTVTKKAVLILGRFTPERKVILDALREALRKYDYLPILFDFEKPSSRNYSETVSTLAHLARFIIADLTDPSSIPQELQIIVPTLAIPVQPVLLEGKREYAMFVDFLRTYHWVLPIHFYNDEDDLLSSLKANIIAPAEQMATELEKR